MDKVVDLPYVSGVAKRFYWSELELEEGVYDFSEIDKIVREAEMLGQSVTLATLLFHEPACLMNLIPELEYSMAIN